MYKKHGEFNIEHCPSKVKVTARLQHITLMLAFTVTIFIELEGNNRMINHSLLNVKRVRHKHCIFADYRENYKVDLFCYQEGYKVICQRSISYSYFCRVGCVIWRFVT